MNQIWAYICLNPAAGSPDQPSIHPTSQQVCALLTIIPLERERERERERLHETQVQVWRKMEKDEMED